MLKLPSSALLATIALSLGLSNSAMATPILPDELASFSVLGATTVTNVPTTTTFTNVGVWSSGGANSITGFNSSPGVPTADPQVFIGNVHAGTALAQLAQGQLTQAIIDLGLMGPGSDIVNPDLTGLTLTPGVYTVHAGITNLSGTLTLDGIGFTNPLWVFQMDSTLITSSGSSIIVNDAPNAGIFWDVRSSATLGSGSTFQGNILALASIALATKASIACGRALADTGAVTLDQNTINTGCDENNTTRFNGGSGNEDDTTRVPEPISLGLLAGGLVILIANKKLRSVL